MPRSRAWPGVWTNSLARLYSLQSDPSEKQNLYDYAERKDVISRLTGDIHRWQESVSDKIKV